MNQAGGERANAQASQHSGLLLPHGMSEVSDIHGTYHAVCRAPRDVDLERYLKLRDELAALQARGILARIAFGARMAYLRAKLEEVELQEVWRDDAPNVVTTVGKNVMLDAALAGSAYTVVGPYLGLIGAVSYTTGPAAADTMASHGGWTEAGTANAPTYTAPRKTVAWSAASAGAKAMSAAQNFLMTGAGTAKGAFMVYFTGAVSTIDNTAGTLFSAGLFTGGDQPVANGNTLSVTYSTSL